MQLNENQSKARSTRIAEALELLNEAAKEKQLELKGLLSDKYVHIQEAFAGIKEQEKEIFEATKKAADYVLLKGEYKVEELLGEADQRVRKDPWAYIAGAAAFSLFVGFLMGSKK